MSFHLGLTEAVAVDRVKDVTDHPNAALRGGVWMVELVDGTFVEAYGDQIGVK